MRKRILFLPGSLDVAGEPPLSEILGEPLRRMQSVAGLTRVTEAPAYVPELAWVGLEPNSHELSQGVLAVSAFGADPPDRSVHFHLSVLSLTDDQVGALPYRLDRAEYDQLIAIARRLETARLKFVGGNDVNHGLVWEDGSIELSAPAPEEAFTSGFRASRPQGDGEPLLRRFIDDSVNLLGDLESNRRREEDGFPPFNLLWPWGPGFRPRLSNLPLARGRAVHWESPSVRLLGLTRLVGYRHGDPWALGRGTNLKLESMLGALIGEVDAVAAIPTLGEFRTQNRTEVFEWFGREVGQRLLAPLIEEARENKGGFMLVATNREGRGLALTFPEANLPAAADLPFGPESFQEASLPVCALHTLMAKELGD